MGHDLMPLRRSAKSHVVSKHAVAVHEAGHVVVTLMSPFREWIVEASVYRNNDKWLGSTVFLDGRETVDRTAVYEIAKNLAGPVAQLNFDEQSVPSDFLQLVKETGSIAEAAHRCVVENLEIELNWAKDL